MEPRPENNEGSSRNSLAIYRLLKIEARRTKLVFAALAIWSVGLTSILTFEYQKSRVADEIAAQNAVAVSQKLQLDIKQASGKLAELRTPPSFTAHALGKNVQALGLLEQSQSISDFIASNPPKETIPDAVSLLKTTNRQVALAASQSNLGLVWSGNAATEGQFPYQVGIVLSNYVPYAQRGYRCGGTLIAPKWVLTAGHCFDEDSQAEDVQVFSGKIKLSDTPADDCNCWTTVARIYRSPTYKLTTTQYGQTIDGDVALLELNESPLRRGVEFIQIADPALETQILKAHLGTISGWGKASSNSSSLSDGLMYGTVKVALDSVCASAYGSGIVMPDMVCANPSPADACSGDSGGALVLHVPFQASAISRPAVQSTKANYVEGVVSWSYPLGACPAKKPTVYARVPALYKWINGCVTTQSCPSSIVKAD